MVAIATLSGGRSRPMRKVTHAGQEGLSERLHHSYLCLDSFLALQCVYAQVRMTPGSSLESAQCVCVALLD